MRSHRRPTARPSRKRLAETLANQRVAQRTLTQSERARAVPTERNGRPRRIPTVGLRGGRKVRHWSDAKGRSISHAHSGCKLGKGACAEVHSWIWFGATLWAKLANACESRGAGRTRLVPTSSLPFSPLWISLSLPSQMESLNANGRSGVPRRQEVKAGIFVF